MHYSPRVLSCWIWSTVRAILRRSEWKLDPPRVPPFKATESHRNRHRSIRHLWLPINVLVPFPRQTAISVENRYFFPPRVFCAPAEGVHLGVGYQRSGQKKLEWWGYRIQKDVWRYLQTSGYNTRTCIVKALKNMPFDTCQIDRRTDTGRQQRPRLRILSRGKKWQQSHAEMDKF